MGNAVTSQARNQMHPMAHQHVLLDTATGVLHPGKQPPQACKLQAHCNVGASTLLIHTNHGRDATSVECGTDYEAASYTASQPHVLLPKPSTGSIRGTTTNCSGHQGTPLKALPLSETVSC